MSDESTIQNRVHTISCCRIGQYS